MDENKSVNNTSNQSNDNMNYSFDFANQVDANTVPATPEVTPVASESNVTPGAPVSDNVTVTPVAGNVVSETSTTENVTPEVTNSQDVTPNVETTSAPEVTPVAENNTTAGNVTEQPSVDVNSVDGIPVMPGVAPVTPETVSTGENNSEQDDIELIKDKKATKKFLIILFIVLLVFIIALPFIFNVAG